MAKITKRIDSDCKSLETYFQKLFDLIEDGKAEKLAAPMVAEDVDSDESQAPYHGFVHFIKPDMLINIYSFLDFWLYELCKYHKINKELILKCNDIQGKNNIHRFRKYFTLYAGLDLSSVEESYQHLQGLRKVRNQFIHGGGHITTGDEKSYGNIPGISLYGSLIYFEDDYVWKSLDHAKKYLLVQYGVNHPMLLTAIH